MCLFGITDVAFFDAFWFDDYDSEVLPRDFVVEIFDFAAEFEGGVVGGIFWFSGGWIFP